MGKKGRETLPSAQSLGEKTTTAPHNKKVEEEGPPKDQRPRAPQMVRCKKVKDGGMRLVPVQSYTTKRIPQGQNPPPRQAKKKKAEKKTL